MTFLETRGTLAKLLATENLLVVHNNKAQTASFDPTTRKLTLPVIETQSESVYNLFIGHEVGHALQTPVDWKDSVIDGTPFDFINVIEDVRIEKFIQDKFPGLRKDFTRGYNELNDKDFFDVAGKDLTKFSLIDRLNLHFKLGSLAMVPFSEEEQMWVQAIDECDTYQKVCLTAKMLSDWLNQKEEDEKEEEEVVAQPDGQDDTEQQEQEQQEEQSDSDEEDEEDEPVSNGGGIKGEEETKEEEVEEEGDDSEPAGNEGGNEFESQTQKSFDSSMQDMAQKGGADYIYLSEPKSDVLKNIITVDELRKDFTAWMETHENVLNDSRFSAIEDQKQEFNEFLKSIKKDVAFMAQQFEMKKAADAYARQSINKTGVLNTSKLHQYKLTDDIFLRQSVTPDGKNHGLVMLIDWSGSMSNVLRNVIKQLFVLVQYCRKVQIPFDVYTFTTSNADGAYEQLKELQQGEIVTSFANVVNVLSSSAKNQQINQDMLNLWYQAYAITSWSGMVPTSRSLDMGGTPLESALFMVPQMIVDFKRRTKAQKVSFVCITDGESSPMVYADAKDNGELRFNQAYYQKILIRDGSKVINLSNDSYIRDTGAIASWIEGKFQDLTVTNIFLGGQSASSSYLSQNGCDSSEFKPADFRKNGSFSTRNGAWPMMSVVNPSVFGNAQEEIAVDNGATKGQIRSALKKYLKSKTSTKVLLGELVEQFA